MSFFGLLFLVFIGWLIYNVARIYLRVRRLQRQGQDFFNQFMGGNPGQSGKGARKPEPDPQPKRPTKKIDPNVGEYVRFEEVSVTAEQTTATRPDGTRTETTQ